MSGLVILSENLELFSSQMYSCFSCSSSESNFLCLSPKNLPFNFFEVSLSFCFISCLSVIKIFMVIFGFWVLSKLWSGLRKSSVLFRLWTSRAPLWGRPASISNKNYAHLSPWPEPFCDRWHLTISGLIGPKTSNEFL